MDKLDPKLLQQLLAMINGTGQVSGTGDLSGWTADTRRDVIGRTGGGGESSTEVYGDPITRLYQQTGHETWGQDTANVFDAQGNYIGPSSGDSEALSLAKFIAASVGGYYGANALNGAMGGAAAGAGEAAASGMANGAFLGEGVASGVGAWDAAAINSALGSGQLGTAASYAGQNLANGTASDTLGSMLNSGNTASNAVNAADVLNTGAKAVGTGLNLGGVLGAAAGALSSKDQEQTTSRDPWKPAQPYLEGLLREGADLYGQYKAQPFNGAQQAGYNNMAGLLDLVNKNAGGLLSGFQANASGANQFRRGVPQQGLIGSSFNPSPQEWNPQSYGRFGG